MMWTLFLVLYIINFSNLYFKMAKRKVDYFKIGCLFAKVLMAITLIYMGVNTCTEPGERTYNKYLHAFRKMIIVDSKPSDIFVASFTYDEGNKILI